MEFAETLKNIFGEYPSTSNSSVYKSETLSLQHQIHELNKWLIEKLSKLDEKHSFHFIDSDCGRIGPPRTVIDANAEPNNCNLSKDKLTIQSQSPFLTVKANCCIFKGKWMYEVQLRSKGVMQIGWCSPKCKFTQDTGVGDTQHSYGLDGSKQRIWHVNTRKYGPYWRSGDIYGVCLDMDCGKIEYYRNGVSLGDAFTDIDRGPGIALYPAFSLAFNDSLTANFGGSPFRHPIKGYAPLQSKPLATLAKAEFLLQHLVNLSRIMSMYKSRQDNGVEPKPTNGDISFKPSLTCFHILVAEQIVGELANVISCCYVVEDKAFMFLRRMCVLRSEPKQNACIYPGQPESTLGTFLTLLWSNLELEDVKEFIGKIVKYMSSMYRETPVDLEYEKQRMVIVVLTCLCNHPKTRRYLLEMEFFQKNCLPVFLYIKPPDESTLAELLPDHQIWTQGLGGSRDQYELACHKLVQCTDILYGLQKNLVENLLQNNDGNQRSASSRKIFMIMLRKYVMENSLEQRTIYLLQGITHTQPAVALSFLCILLDVLQTMFKASELPNYVLNKYFYSGKFYYTHLDRIGGVVSHLNKLYRQELLDKLGENHSALRQEPAGQAESENSDVSIYSAMLLITGGNSSTTANSMAVNMQSSRSDNILYLGRRQLNQTLTPATVQMQPGNVDDGYAINELLDCCILYYYAVAHKYVVMIADLRDNIGLLSDILVETESTYNSIHKQMDQSIKEDETEPSASASQSCNANILDEIIQRFDHRKNIFKQRSIELARKQAWYRSLALGQRRKKLLTWMLGTVFETLKQASKDGGLFAFVPEVYINILPILLDTILDFSFHDLKEQYDLTDAHDIVQSAATFLSEHSADERVVLASCKDSLLQALGTLTCHQAGIEALENCTRQNQLTLVSALLRPYENRAWGQNNWLLMRFWLGKGYAFRDSRPPCIWQSASEPRKSLGLPRSRGKNGSHTGLLHHIAPAYPSTCFHELIAFVLLDNEQLSTAFINSILSQLNWAFSEFILLLQEIQNNTQRQQDQNQFIESRQLKICSMCFELTVSLMRSLEMLLVIASPIFIDPARTNSDLLLKRVCELIGQVLSRVTVPPGCFQFVIDLCLPDLSSVTHFSIISATIGILLALLKDELKSNANVFHVTKLLLTDPSFQIAGLEFALGELKTPILAPVSDYPRGNFDPKMRSHIDPLTNEVRIPPAIFDQRGGTDSLIIGFNLKHYKSHVSDDEIHQLEKMITMMLKYKAVMSDVVLPSDDSICPICYSMSVSATFQPCKHQSCTNCIAQYLMNNKVCFYCKTLIVKVVNFDGKIIYDRQPNREPELIDSVDVNDE